MRIVFAGSTFQAAECLEEIARKQEVTLVLTRPDAPRGRGLKESPNPVKEKAEELGIEVFDGEPSDSALAEKIREKKIRCGAVVAYGRLIPPPLLSLLEKGWYNLHFSLLPYFRGSNPVAACVLNRYAHCGVTVFKLTEGLDDGPWLIKIPYLPSSALTTGELTQDLTEIGKKALTDALKAVEKGKEKLTAQEKEPDLKYAGKIDKPSARINFSRPREEIFYKVLACNPNPMAWTEARAGGKTTYVKLNRLNMIDFSSPLNPGSLVCCQKKAFVCAANGWLELAQITPAGKKKMSGDTWLRGIRGEAKFLQPPPSK